MDSKQQYEWAVFIGRMQPPHNGHIRQILNALDIAKNVVVVLGSNRAARNPKNPWSVEEREAMIRSCLPNKPLNFVSVNDYPYSEETWLAEVQSKVGLVTGDSNSVVLVGHKKDRSSYYLDSFPQWEQCLFSEWYDQVSATEIRKSLFNGLDPSIIKDQGVITESVSDWLASFINTPEYKILKDEYNYYQDYNKQWENAPYKPTFQTVDTVLVKSGHVLLVERKLPPGVNQLALPGGFVNSSEWLLDSAIRELKEETRIKIEGIKHIQPYLRSYMVNQHVFDYPHRSLRGRTITMAYYVKLPDGGPLPLVKGSSDAKTAMWVSFRDILNSQERFFEDHLDIIGYFTGM